MKISKKNLPTNTNRVRNQGASGVLLFFLCLAVAATPAAGSIISVNISDGSTGNPYIGPAVSFGVSSEGTVVENWNNIGGFANATNMIRSDGTTSGVAAASRNGGGTSYWGVDYAHTPWNFGVAHYVGTTGEVSLGFSNLNAEFPLGYYAIVYVNGAPPNSGAAITDDTTTYYFKTSDPADPAPIRITDTVDDGVYEAGNYAVFGSLESPLSLDSITFTIPTGSVVSNNAGIGGAQLVAVPEPATTGLLAGIGALAALLVIRRRRC